MNSRENNLQIQIDVRSALEQLENSWNNLKEKVYDQVNQHYYALIFINNNSIIIEDMLNTMYLLKMDPKYTIDTENTRRIYYVSAYLSDICNSLCVKNQLHASFFSASALKRG